jgi:filamentous hemagglutinin family protein
MAFNLRVLLIAIMVMQPIAPAWAGIKGEKVVRGDVNFAHDGDFTRIEASNNSIINYEGFGVLKQETIQFVQPSSASRVLNRVQGPDPTEIAGSLLANGQVYITNPAGVFFAKGALVDVGAIYAAAGNMTNEDFLNNVNHFTDVTGSVINSGTIAADAVNLIGKHVANHGSILADGGTVMLLAGEDVYVGQVGGSVFVKLEGAGADLANSDSTAGVDNSGTVDAKKVVFGAGDLYSMAIRTTGKVKAKEIAVEGGEQGTVVVGGSLDASDAAGKGGTIELTGGKVGLFGAEVDASGTSGGGTVLVGGDYQGKGELQTAEQTYVSGDSAIKADAIDTGDGGKVVVWADGKTSYYGSISARGGAQSGDGGLVEVSGKETLNFAGAVDTRAPKGEMGTLLLDPTNIEVVNAGAAETSDLGDVDAFGDPDPNPPGPDGDTKIWAGALDVAGANVELQANNDIIFNADVNMLNPGIAIKVRAGNNITVNKSITTDNGDISFTANDSGGIPILPVTGQVDINAPINTKGGSFTSSGVDFNNVDSGAITATGGITINHASATLGDVLNGGVGDVTLNADGAVTQTVAGAITASGLELLGAGSYTLTNGSNNVDTLAANTTNNISYTDADALTVGTVQGTSGINTSGDVTLNAGGAVTQTVAGTITASGLELLGAGSYTLTNGSNNVDTLAADTTNDISYTDADDLTVGTVLGTSGINTNGNAVSLKTETGGGGTLAFNSAVGAVSVSDITLNADGAVTQTVAGTITASGLELLGAGSYTLTNGSNNVDTLAADTTNDISYTDADALTVGTVQGTSGISTSNNVTLNADDAVTQTVAGTITASGLELLGAGSYMLTNVSNNVGILAANTTNDISYTDADGLIVGTVGVGTSGITSNNVTLTAGTITQNSGIISAGRLTATSNSFGSLGDRINTDVDTLEVDTIGGGAAGVQYIDEADGLASATLVSNGGRIDLVANGTVTGATVTTSGGNAEVKVTGGDITSSTVNAGVGSALLSAVNISGSTVTAGPSADLIAGNDISNSGASAADVYMEAGNNVSGFAVNATTATVIATTGDITDTDDLVDVTAWAAWIEAGMSIGAVGDEIDTDVDVLVAKAGNDIYLSEEDDIDIIPVPGLGIIAGGKVEIINANGVGIGLGATPVAGGLNLSDGDLLWIMSGSLELVTGGAIVVDGITGVNSDNVNTVTLDADDKISFAGNASEFDGLIAKAANGIDVGVNLTTDEGDLSLDGNDDILFANGVQLSATAGAITLDAPNGDMNGIGALTLNADKGISINDSLTTAGTTVINADITPLGDGDLTVASGSTVSTTGNALNITANDIDLSGNLSSGVAATTITDSDGGGIGLGDTAVTNGLNLSGSELERIAAAYLELETAGSITVDDISAANSNNVGTVTLDAAGSIEFANAPSTFNALDVQADNGISINEDLATDTGILSLDGDANGSADGSDGIAFADGVTVTSATSLTLATTNGSLTGAGALTLNADNGISIKDSLTTAGTTVINADTSGLGAGDLEIAFGSTVSTTGNALNITANDIDLLGNLSSGVAATTITDSDGGGIGLGTLPVAGRLNLSDVELGNITAGSLELVTSGVIVVDGITEVNSDNVNTVTLNADDKISFENNPSEFDGLIAKATNGINIDVNLTTDEADLVMENNFTSTANNMLAKNGNNITLKGTGTFSAANSQAVSASGTIHAEKALTKGTDDLVLKAGVKVDLDDVVTVSGGSLLVAGPVIEAGNDLTGATDVVLDGAVTAGSNITAINNNVTVVGVADVTGAVSAGNDVLMQSSATLRNNVTAGRNVTVAGVADVTGAVSAGNDVLMQSSATLRNNVTGGNSVTFNDVVTLNGGTNQEVNAVAGELHAMKALSKTGAGNLDLKAGSLVNLDGAVNVSSGDLSVTGKVDAESSLTAAGSVTLNSEAALAGNVTGGNNVTFNSAVVLDGATQRIKAGSTLLASQTLTKTETGDLDLEAGSLIDLDGVVSVNAGSLLANGKVDAQSDLIASNDVILQGVANLGGNVTGGGDVIINQAAVLDGGSDQELAAAQTLQAAQTLTKTSAGNLALKGVTLVDLNNAVSVEGGSLLVENKVDAEGNLTASGNVTLQGVANLAGNVAGNGVVFIQTVVADGDGVQSFDAGGGTLAASETITKSGNGDLILGGDTLVDLAKTVQVDKGGLTITDAVNADGDLVASGLVLLEGTADLAGDVTGGGVTFAKAVTADGDDQRFDATNGVLSADDTIIKSNSGNLTLGGTLVNLEKTVHVASGNLTIEDIFAAAGDFIAGNDVNLMVDGVLDGGASQRIDAVGGSLLAGGTITKSGTGELTLGGGTLVNLADNVKVNSGGLIVEDELVAAGDLTASGSVSLKDKATVSGDVTGSGITFVGIVTATGGNQEFDATDGILLASETITKNGSGNLTLSGDTLVDLNKRVSVNVGDLVITDRADGESELYASGSVKLGDVANLAGNVTGGNNVTLEKAVTLDGVATQEIKAETGTLALATLDKTAAGELVLTANEIDLNGPVSNAGRDIKLQPSSVGQDIQVAGDIIDSGNVLYLSQGDLGNVQNGAALVIIGRDDGSGLVTVGGGGGDVVFNDPVVIQSPIFGGAITVASTLRGADNASITLNGAGATTLNADIVTRGNFVRVKDSVQIGNDVAVMTTDNAGGADITIEGKIDGEPSLTLAAGIGNVTLENEVGESSAPASLAVTGRNISLADVTTAGSQTYSADELITISGNYNSTGSDIHYGVITRDENGDVLSVEKGNVQLAGDVTVSTAGMVGDDVVFAGTIDGGYELSIDAGQGDIIFGNDIGADTALASLETANTGIVEFNSTVTTTGDIKLGDVMEIPDSATIYKKASGNLIFKTNGGEFRMEFHQKLSLVDGDLVIETDGGNVYLGDLSVGGNITVDAGDGEIYLQLRDVSDLLVFDYDSGYGVEEEPVEDRGLDFVATGWIKFLGSDVKLEGNGPNPQFATGDISASKGTSGYVNRQMSFVPLLYDPASGLMVVLDLQASGVTTANAAEALAGVLEEQRPMVSMASTLNPALLEQLVRLGINARPDSAITGDGITYTIFNDVDYVCKLLNEVCPVSPGRLDADLTAEAVDNYWKLFWEKTEEGMEARARAPEISRVLQEALNAFKAQTDVKEFDPLAFRKYLEGAGGEALRYVNTFRNLFIKIRMIGLTRYEFKHVNDVLLRDIELQWDGEMIGMDELEKLIRGPSSYDYLLTWSIPEV